MIYRPTNHQQSPLSALAVLSPLLALAASLLFLVADVHFSMNGQLLFGWCILAVLSAFFCTARSLIRFHFQDETDQ